MDKILLNYYHGERSCPLMGIPANTEYPYTKRKRNYLIDRAFDRQYNVMLQCATRAETGEKVLIIWLDTHSFKQR